MKIFYIKVYDNFDVIFRLIICKTKKEMYKARQKYDISEKGIDTGKEWLGCFTPMAYHTNGDDIRLPGSFHSNVFGTVYLNLDDLYKQGDKVIVHECGHAAFAFEHYLRCYIGNFRNVNNYEHEANGGGDEQEVFCNFLENAFDKARQAVKEYKASLNRQGL